MWPRVQGHRSRVDAPMCSAPKPAGVAAVVGLRVDDWVCAGGADDCCPDGWSCQAVTDGQSTTCAGR